jgi:hypothetical protein
MQQPQQNSSSRSNSSRRNNHSRRSRRSSRSNNSSRSHSLTPVVVKAATDQRGLSPRKHSWHPSLQGVKLPSCSQGGWVGILFWSGGAVTGQLTSEDDMESKTNNIFFKYNNGLSVFARY